MENRLLFALDIGTRSVVGIVGKQNGRTIEIITCEREEHHTRSMLDGQIHDVPEVACIIKQIKDRLEQAGEKLHKVAVAAAGRALITIKASAKIDTSLQAVLTQDDERTLQIAAIQEAQKKLSASGRLADPTSYYCVGYSIINYILDETPIKTLIGQRGKTASANLIATFLPRQVIDSIQSALKEAELELSSLTLEPIAAINVLIPSTMRHLNIALVDIGAGTSDVAITSQGSVTGYGMVPCAGDEITEALSQKYLLDFNIAEEVKRQINSSADTISFCDILGMEQTVSVNELKSAIIQEVSLLGQSIAKEILALNNTPPQAVLLVGGGALTPMLPQAIAEALDLPLSRVAVRKPDKIDTIPVIPQELCTPDAVTPLGILNIAAQDTLNFVNIELNGQPLRLFNLGQLKVTDALLAAGIDIRSIQGRPGLGITIHYNGQILFFPGTRGQAGSILLNGKPAYLEDSIKDNDKLTITKGNDGTSPSPTVAELADLPESYHVFINSREYIVSPIVKINGTQVSPDTKLKDRDTVEVSIPTKLSEVLRTVDYPISGWEYSYIINDEPYTYPSKLSITVNNMPADLDTSIGPNAQIIIVDAEPPTVQDILGLKKVVAQHISVIFNGKTLRLINGKYNLSVNGSSVPLDFKPPNNSNISYNFKTSPPIISEVLLAAQFDASSLSPLSKFAILLNGVPAEFTSQVKNGDKIDIVVENV